MRVLPRSLLPDNAAVTADGRLSIAGCDPSELAAEFGTPLFVYDEEHVRARCREAVTAFPGGVAYATKAFICGEMVRLAAEEGLALDVSTGGEIHVALAAGADPRRLVFHGNNKSVAELAKALDAGVGRIVVDSMIEIDRIEELLETRSVRPKVMVRLNPGVEAHTHEFLRTGAVDSKFGLGIDDGAAVEAVRRIESSSLMEFVGIHAHVGSQVFEVESFRRALEMIAGFVSGLDVEELSIGGGLGVAYVEGEVAPSITDLSLIHI